MIPLALNRSDPEAADLVACYVATPGGMLDLIAGTVGTVGGNASSRISELGQLEAAFDGNADSFAFGTDIKIAVGAPFTIVWESYLEQIGSGFDTFPCVGTFARGVTSQPFRIVYSDAASYRDIVVGYTDVGGNADLWTLPSGITRTGMRHWGVWSYNGGTFATDANHAMWVNGAQCTNTGTPGSLASITDTTTVGRTSLTTTDWYGGIRQVRLYLREWNEAEANRFFDPRTRDSLFRLPNRRIYSFPVTTSGVDGSGAITEAADTVSSAGTVDVQGAGSITEAADTVSSAGTVDVQGAGSITEAADTVSSAGTVDVQAAGSITEAADTVSSEGTVGALPIEATGSITEAADIVSSAGTVDVQGAGSITEAADTVSSAGAVDVQAAGSITEAADALSSEGVVGTVPIEATGSITEAADTVSSASTVDVQGAGSITEAADTVSSAGTVDVQGAGSITETADTVSGAGEVATLTPIDAAGAITEASDTLAATAVTRAFVEGNTNVFYLKPRPTRFTVSARPTRWTARRAA